MIPWPYRAASKARMLYLAIRPKVMAARNFLREYLVAPAARTNGIIGIGGGSNAGIAIAPNPQRSKVFVMLKLSNSGKVLLNYQGGTGQVPHLVGNHREPPPLRGVRDTRTPARPGLLLDYGDHYHCYLRAARADGGSYVYWIASRDRCGSGGGVRVSTRRHSHAG